MTEWVKCSERLPDDKVFCIVSDGKYITVSVCYHGGWLMSNYMWNQPTHWQPLPELPTD